jgi:DNA-binding NarL/FixJ family response regulator
MLIEVLIADDNELLRTALRSCLEADSMIAVVAMAADGQEAVELAVRERPRVVLMDLRMPRLDGLSATRRIIRDHPATRVLMHTGVARRSTVREAFAAGASGYLLKNGNREAVVAGVRECASGGRALSAELRSFLGPNTGW